MDNYLDKIKEQLKTMTEREKDEWILAQVKRLCQKISWKMYIKV
ncbi:MAG: hypothetical protein ACLTAI_12430 [Thomasclavelia sp.]